MSPEQITGGHLDGRSDLFSLGIILYSMLAGQKPFTGESATSVMFNITYKEPIPLTQLNPSLDLLLDPIVARALAKRPEDRYQSGREFAQDLETWAKARHCILKSLPESGQTRNKPLSKTKAIISNSSAPKSRLRANWLTRSRWRLRF
jgi:serine/threonine protein kinase